MMSVSIRTEWFEEIKDLITCESVEVITEGDYAGQVELEVNTEEFERVSRELGWMA